MYVNPHFAADDPEQIYRAIQDYPFGILTVVAENSTHAAHIPFVVRRGEGKKGTLWGHVPQRDPIAANLREGSNSLVIFNGPSAYISPAWYENPGLPTYNFVAVHVRGAIRLIDDRSVVHEHLVELVSMHEDKLGNGWSLAQASDDFVHSLVPHIQAFSLEIDELVAKFKLSQNRSAGDRVGAIRGLRKAGLPGGDAIASVMETFAYSHDDMRPLLDLSKN